MFKSSVVAIVLVLASNLPAFAQSDRTRKWESEMSALTVQSGSTEAGTAAVMLLHQEITDWLALNPATDVTLAMLPPRPWTRGQLAEELTSLQQAVSQIAQHDPNQPFYLGATTVQVTAPASTLSP